MGYSIKDIDNAARGINQRLEAHSQRQGEELANRLISSTSQGRGLWVFLLWPVWVLIAAFSSAFFVVLLQKFGVKPPLAYAGYVGGLLFARAWYQWDFTARHPFWSSIIGNFGLFR